MRMRLGIKGKQVLGVTSIVGAVVVVLSLMHLATLAQVSLEESRARAELLANAIFHRAARGGRRRAPIRNEALRDDPGLRSILESSLYSKNVTFAAIVDRQRRGRGARRSAARRAAAAAAAATCDGAASRSPLAQLRAIYSGQGRNLEFRQPLLLGDTEFGSIRIGVSTLLIRRRSGRSRCGPARR